MNIPVFSAILILLILIVLPIVFTKSVANSLPLGRYSTITAVLIIMVGTILIMIIVMIFGYGLWIGLRYIWNVLYTLMT